MNRRRFVRSLAAGSAGVMLASGGAKAQAPSMPRYPLSDHFDGRTFRNPRNHEVRSLFEILRWKTTSRPTPWPERAAWPGEIVGQGPLAVRCVGHATFLIEIGGLTLLTDPIWSERASPVSWAGPRRVQPPGVAFERLPRIDAVLLSHDHYDHCDLPTLRALASGGVGRVITPLANGDLLREAGFADSAITELDWWQTFGLPGGVEVEVTPAQHWSNRVTGPRNGRLWGGFAVRARERRLFFAGDTAWNQMLFEEIRSRIGPPDIAVIPIGAYEPRWFMAAQHCNPEEAVRIHRVLEARRSVGMHWGTFPLTDEGWDEPVEALGVALAGAGLEPETFLALGPGGRLAV